MTAAPSRPPAAAPDGETVAAVDLGSNSFHMVVARVVDGQLHIVDKLRERVALAAGLDDDKKLTKAARDRALRSLTLFGQRLAHMPHGSVRAVGTNTLRQAKNSREFLASAERALGHPLEIISGREEARLIYLGVARTTEDPRSRRLVVDIGGGSTECVIGEGFEPLATDSLYMGCVTFARFFPRGQIKQRYFDEAMTAASLELRPLVQRYQQLGWTLAVGASGTVTSIESIVKANGWSNRGITAKGLKRLRKALVAAGTVDSLSLDGMPPDRAQVLAPGAAILSAVFERFEVDRMFASDGALREGLVYDLVGRIHQQDIREDTIRSFSERYHVDVEQAQRVEVTAMRLLDTVAESWDLQGPGPRRILAWAARLHEIGKAVSYSGYHKHGAYLVRHSDMPGFSREDQTIMGEIIEGHRRKLRPQRFEGLPVEREERALRVAILLRLAVVLNRSRSRRAVPAFRFWARKRVLELAFPPGWLDENVLSRADLEAEAERLAAAGHTLTIR